MNTMTLVFILVILSLLSAPLYSQVSVDITAKELDEIKGTFRVRDLVVNDEARIYGGSLCIKDEKLYLPDSETLISKPVDDYGIDLKIRILPAKKVQAETVLPNTNQPDRIRDSIEGFLGSILMPSWLDNTSPYCLERAPTDAIGQRVEYLEVESIDGHHSFRKVYEGLLERMNK